MSLFHTSPNALEHTGHVWGLSFSCTLRSCTLSVQRSAKATEHRESMHRREEKKHAHRQRSRVSRVSSTGLPHTQRSAKMHVDTHTPPPDGCKCMPTYTCHRRCTRKAAGARAPPQCGGGGTPFGQTDTRTADTQTPWPGPRTGRRCRRGASPPPTYDPGSSWCSARRGGSRADSQSARRTTKPTGGHRWRRWPSHCRHQCHRPRRGRGRRTACLDGRRRHCRGREAGGAPSQWRDAHQGLGCFQLHHLASRRGPRQAVRPSQPPPEGARWGPGRGRKRARRSPAGSQPGARRPAPLPAAASAGMAAGGCGRPCQQAPPPARGGREGALLHWPPRPGRAADPRPTAGEAERSGDSTGPAAWRPAATPCTAPAPTPAGRQRRTERHRSWPRPATARAPPMCWLVGRAGTAGPGRAPAAVATAVCDCGREHRLRRPAASPPCRAVPPRRGRRGPRVEQRGVGLARRPGYGRGGDVAPDQQARRCGVGEAAEAAANSGRGAEGARLHGSVPHHLLSPTRAAGKGPLAAHHPPADVPTPVSAPAAWPAHWGGNIPPCRWRPPPPAAAGLLCTPAW